MNTIKCIAIDDEPLALTIIEEYIAKVPFLELTGKFTNAHEASIVIQNDKPEILFLDIQMPEIKGTDFIRTLIYKPAIILTTAYAEYAVEGYSLDVTDYLLKPIPFDRFLQAINKAARLISSKEEPLVENKKNFLFVKTGYKSVKINFDDILYIEGSREYVTIFTQSNKYLQLDTLKKMETLLPENKFIRVHKSYIINTDFINAHYGNTIEIGNIKIPIGRAYKDSVQKLIQ